MNTISIQHVHLFFVLVSLLSVSASLAFASFYLIQQGQLKHKKNTFLFSRLPSLEALDRYVIRSLIIASISMSVLVVTGIFLAHVEWHRDWMHDEKFILAVLTWAWSIFTLLLRFKIGLRGERFFYSILIGMFFLVASCLIARVM